MLPSMMARQALTRRRYPVTEDHGNSFPDYSAEPTSSAEFWGSVQPGSGERDPINRNGVEVAYTVFTDLSCDATHLDLVALPDGDYFVNGAPEVWATGILDHKVVRLSRWTG